MLNRFLTVVGFSLLLAGCGGGGSGPSALPSLPRTQQAAAAVTYVALGDSITYGLTASSICAPTTPTPFASCPSGTSYVDDLARDLSASGAPVTLQDLGIPGATIAQMVTDEVPHIDPAATFVSVYIGTNDIPAINDGQETAAQYASLYAQTIASIRAAAPSAEIIIATVPDNAYLPCCVNSGLDPATSNAINDAIEALYDGKIRIVDLACASSSYDPNNISAGQGGVHPNDAGYAAIAAQFFAAMSQPPSAPAASCAPYKS